MREHSMIGSYVCWAALGIAVGACGVVETTSTAVQAGTELHGTELQGTELQGTELQGTRLDGATMSGVALQHLRVERGELVAERGQITLRGTALAGAHLLASVRNPTPPAAATVEYRIAAIVPEDPQYDP